ncbi:hypothetical protein DFH29DRAFT_1010236 [Suillus ampliporus]|nr:hypothetical protein DFH29DRAFT_1010236 [Suillus ampliporus]
MQIDTFLTLADPPPPCEEEEDPATGSKDCGSQMHSDTALENIENFLKSCDFDLGHLTGAFVTHHTPLPSYSAIPIHFLPLLLPASEKLLSTFESCLQRVCPLYLDQRRQTRPERLSYETPMWTAPESWAVEKDGEEDVDVGGDSSSEESTSINTRYADATSSLKDLSTASIRNVSFIL